MEKGKGKFGQFFDFYTDAIPQKEVNDFLFFLLEMGDSKENMIDALRVMYEEEGWDHDSFPEYVLKIQVGKFWKGLTT